MMSSTLRFPLEKEGSRDGFHFGPVGSGFGVGAEGDIERKGGLHQAANLGDVR